MNILARLIVQKTIFHTEEAHLLEVEGIHWVAMSLLKFARMFTILSNQNKGPIGNYILLYGD